MWITDNTSFKGEAVQTIKNTYPKLLNKLSNNTLENLAQSSNLLLFPNDISESGDLDKDAMIVKTYNGTIQFQNVIGFIGYGQERLNIHSRFSTEGMGDNFLHYMLKRVLNINVTNLETDTSNKLELYDLLRYIFPSYLNAALKKGVLRQYQRFEYNDASIKGTIDIARHIKQNTPFTGKVAYSTREYTGDNNVMELIRHTIEYIQSSSRNGNQILNSSDEVRHNVAAVIRSTPSYSIGKRQKVIIKNQLTPVRHAFYTEYRDLQRLCLMILRHQKNNLGDGDDQTIHGIIFDVAWLWEEYLNTLMKDKGIQHPHNRADNRTELDKKNPFYIFKSDTESSKGRRLVYPDFFSTEGKFVLDGKYKKGLDNDGDNKDSKGGLQRNDLNQMITYMYIQKYCSASVIYPATTKGQGETLIGVLNGYGAKIFKYGLMIPQNIADFASFESVMKKSEAAFGNYINKRYND